MNPYWNQRVTGYLKISGCGLERWFSVWELTAFAEDLGLSLCTHVTLYKDRMLLTSIVITRMWCTDVHADKTPIRIRSNKNRNDYADTQIARDLVNESPF